MRDRDTLEWRNLENPRFASGSVDPVELDAVVAGMLGTDPNDIGYLRLASETFGAWDERAVKEAYESYSQLFI
jgi:hypothetical protein